jgi:hypothetical protein
MLVMRNQLKGLFAVAGAGLVVTASLFMVGRLALAADHLDPPGRTNINVDTTPDLPADIADIFAWHTDTKFIISIDFAGPRPVLENARYDRDVLYTLNIANGPDKSVATIPVNIRFGVDNSSGTPRFGVQVTGVPGVDGAIIGPVESRIEKDGVIVMAGLFDDPFFFDSLGFNESRAMGVLRFTNQRDFFGRQNLTAVIIEIPRERIQNGNNVIGVWGVTKRFGGNL